MTCKYKLNDGSPCRCGALCIEDGAGVGHYDCVGPPGGMCTPDGGLPLQCRVCKTPCGDGVHDPGRCANCYNMGIVGFNAGRVITERLATVERVTEMQKWIWAVTMASAASELEARKR